MGNRSTGTSRQSDKPYTFVRVSEKSTTQTKPDNETKEDEYKIKIFLINCQKEGKAPKHQGGAA